MTLETTNFALPSIVGPKTASPGAATPPETPSLMGVLQKVLSHYYIQHCNLNLHFYNDD